MMTWQGPLCDSMSGSPPELVAGATPTSVRLASMRRFRSALVLPLAVLATSAVACSAGTDTADESVNPEPSISNDDVVLDGIAVEVRRDPG